jgi:phosphoribosylglycinamide formyltransferase 1
MNGIVLASGAGTNFEAILAAIDCGKIDAQISALIVDRKDTGAENIARKKGIPVTCVEYRAFQNRPDFDRELIQCSVARNPDFILALGFMRILPVELVSLFQNRIINIHPSLLPAFPGLSAQKQALDYGARITGVTVHFVDGSVDTGPIIAQSAVEIPQGATLSDLKDRIRIEEHRLIVDVVSWFCRGQISVDGRDVRVSLD